MTGIISGNAGGRRLATPSGPTTRPTTDRVREALFSSIESWCGSLQGSAVPRPLRRLRRGRAGGLVARRGRRHPGRVGPSHRPAGRPTTPDARLRQGRRGDRQRSRSCSGRPAAPYDVVFLDPPYPLDEVTVAATSGSSRPGAGWSPARWSWSSARRAARSRRGPTGIEGERSKRYGETTLWYGHAAPWTPRRTDAPSRLPGLLRPGDQRSPRHRPARLEPSSTRSSSPSA